MAAPGIFGPKLLSLISHSTAVASFGSSRAKFLATCAKFFLGSPDLNLLLSPQVNHFFSLMWHWLWMGLHFLAVKQLRLDFAALVFVLDSKAGVVEAVD